MSSAADADRSLATKRHKCSESAEPYVSFFVLFVAEKTFESRHHEGALHKSPKYHPRQWVDRFRSFLQKNPKRYVNPTHGSGWILQIPCRQHLNNRPTAVGWDSSADSELE